LDKSDALQEHLKGFQIWLQDAGFESDPSDERIWNGSIPVEWIDSDMGHNNVSEHHLSIILPQGFPYREPMIVSRDDPPLDPSWHLAPGSPHTLCLWNSQTGWRPHFTAQFLLQHIEDWFYNYHTDSWPANSEVPDLHLYLEEEEGLVVIGDEWTPPRDQKSGRFTFWRYQRFYRTLPCLASCCTNGDESVILQKPEARLTENLIFIEKDIERLAGVWFRLDRPFVPPHNLRELLNHIDADLGMEQGWSGKECIHVFGHKLPGNGFPIALGYTDNQSQERWLFLWAQLLPSTNGKKRQKVKWLSPENLSRIRMKSFQTAPARKADLLRRSAYLSRRLGSCKAVVFGVGALGGSVAVLLAKAGTGEIRLVDSDILIPGNVIRHVCGLNQAGFEKTKAVERTVHLHNPDCCVACYRSTWNPEELQGYIEGCDVVVDTTANHNFSLYLNELCLVSSRPVIFAAAYRRAAVGRVIVHRNSDDPCLACYVDPIRFWSEDEYPYIPPDPEGTFIEDGCGVVTEEAVALDVEAVANLTSRVAIRIMQGQFESKNLAILVNEPLADTTGILAQEGLHWKANKPLANCLVCRG
jgi:molybdopterin/thiamine biosynthesis adenylyltransferase